MASPVTSSLCFGCEALGGTDWGDVDISAIEQALEQALDIGVNFFDTAAIYGLTHSETRLASTLGHRKHDVVIATKGGLSWNQGNGGRAIVWKDSSPEAIRAGVHGSLRRMGLDFIPIYFIHWPDVNTPFEATFSTLQRLKADGLIGAIGCSNFNVEELTEARRFADVEYVQGSLNLFLENRNTEMLHFCRDNGMHFIAYNALGSGLLTGKYGENNKFADNDRRSRLEDFRGNKLSLRLRELGRYKHEAARLDMSILEYALRWALSQPSVLSVITGIKSVDQLVTNWGALNSGLR